MANRQRQATTAATTTIGTLPAPAASTKRSSGPPNRRASSPNFEAPALVRESPARPASRRLAVRAAGGAHGAHGCQSFGAAQRRKTREARARCAAARGIGATDAVDGTRPKADGTFAASYTRALASARRDLARLHSAGVATCTALRPRASADMPGRPKGAGARDGDPAAARPRDAVPAARDAAPGVGILRRSHRSRVQCAARLQCGEMPCDGIGIARVGRVSNSKYEDNLGSEEGDRARSLFCLQRSSRILAFPDSASRQYGNNG